MQIKSLGLSCFALSVLLAGCAARSTTTTSSLTLADSQTSDCKVLVAQADRVDALEGAFEAPDADPASGLPAFIDGLGAATREVDALAPKNPEVQSLAKDLSTYLQERSDQLRGFLPVVTRLTAAHAKYDDAKKTYGKLMAGCETTSLEKATPACNRKLAKALKVLSDPELELADAEIAGKTFVQDPEQKATNSRLESAHTSLAKRLSGSCGRPIPSAHSSSN